MNDKSIIFRRLLLLLKLIYKPLVLLSGYGLFAAMIADANRIYADIPGVEHAYQAILWCVRNLPVRDVLETYKNEMLTFDHFGVANTITLFTMIPFIPLLLGGFFKGLGAFFLDCSQYFYIDYVYRDTGQYAFSEEGPGFLMLLLGIMLRVTLIILFIEISPAVLIISWFYNLIQFLFFKPGRTVGVAN